jgi:hypothetical protein
MISTIKPRNVWFYCYTKTQQGWIDLKLLNVLLSDLFNELSKTWTTVVPPYLLIRYPRFTAAWNKNWKFKKEMVRKFQYARQARSGRSVLKSSSPNMPSTDSLYFHRTYLRSASSILAVVAISQFLYSESPYLSIKVYCIYNKSINQIAVQHNCLLKQFISSSTDINLF